MHAILDSGAAPAEGLAAWRARLLRVLLHTFVILGTVAYVPCVWLSIRERLWVVAAVDTAVYAAVLFLYLASRPSYLFRVRCILIITYSLSLVLLATLGPFGAGELWLFVFPILAGVLLGVRAAVLALVLNAATLVAVGVALPWLETVSPQWAGRGLAGWVALSVNFILLDAVVTFSLALLVRGLDGALERVRESSRRLDAERADLEHANQRLRHEIEERRIAEERRNELERRLMEAQKMEAVGRLAGGVAHDFNNLLTAVIGYADVLLARPEITPAAAAELNEIRRAAGRAAELTGQLLAFGRKQPVQPRVLALGEVVREASGLLRRLVGERIELALDVGREAGRICADAGQIERILVNLALNARDAMPEGGRLTIRTADLLVEGGAGTPAGPAAGRWVLLLVEDTGAGIDPALRARIFEPFFTTKSGGTGLGLATVYGIVQQAGGTVQLDSAPGRGTRFSVFFPRVEEPAAAGAAGAAPRDRAAAESAVPLRGGIEPGGSETLLLVEDDANVRRLTRLILEERGYRVLEAGSGAEALDHVRRHPGAIHLLITDIVMAGMKGDEVAERAREERAGLRVLYMSAFVDDALLRHLVRDPRQSFLAKPFTPADLARTVRAVLDSADGGAAPAASLPVRSPGASG